MYEIMNWSIFLIFLKIWAKTDKASFWNGPKECSLALRLFVKKLAKYFDKLDE